MQKEKISLNNFEMLSLLGYGNYAKVALVRKKQNHKLYAMKIIKKIGTVENIKKDHAYIQKEVLTKCKNPFIISVHTTFQYDQKLYFILEYCPGGQLFGVIKRHKRLAQQVAKFYAAQILIGLQCLHYNKIIYKDLKPENILIDVHGYIRIIDFGLSIKVSNGGKYHSEKFTGTPQYLSPENFKDQKLSYEVDWWGFGNIIFEMIAGFPPFFVNKQTMVSLKQKIINQQPPMYLITSHILKDLLMKLLEKNPQKRLGFNGVKEIKQHPWFKTVPWQEIIQKKVKAPFIPKLKSESDISYFDTENQHINLSPPQQKQYIENYQSFSLSWKSSDRACSPSQDASPTQIVLKIQNQQNQ